MQVQLNGKDTLLRQHCVTVADILAETPWKGRRVLVEVNGEVVPKDAYGVTRLSEGDRIEFVHFVGGG
ncbi:sulfur carrier protein ThiS [Paenibacillus sp. GCM10012306]|uniref:sulfur carrier protein ThiS n=1 Tax=Paenibacillus sp. GCM10012306 TaxID=3317342 RepID=UPI00361F157B